MSKIISKIIEITPDKMPPEVEFIENEIKKQGLEPLRWAIVDKKDNKLIASVSGRVYN